MSNTVNAFTLKDLAKQAKKRLLACNYTKYKKENKMFNDIPAFYLNNKVVTQEEMCIFYEKVIDLLDAEDVITNPLARLTDYDYYKTLDSNAKARYIYGISSIYIYLKERYIRVQKEKKRTGSA